MLQYMFEVTSFNSQTCLIPVNRLLNIICSSYIETAYTAWQVEWMLHNSHIADLVPLCRYIASYHILVLQYSFICSL